VNFVSARRFDAGSFLSAAASAVIAAFLPMAPTGGAFLLISPKYAPL